MGNARVTELLVAWGEGDATVVDQLMMLVYEELHRMASRRVAAERDRSLQATALVHEAFLRLVDQHSVRWQNRAHFFAIAARLMRRILIDQARQHRCLRRGGGAWHVSLGAIDEIALHRAADLIALEDALQDLAKMDTRKAQVVELRFFGGLSVDETAEVLGVSAVTIMRDWSTAKAWLHREIRRDSSVA